MATRQNDALKPSEVVGAVSKFAGALVGTAAGVGKKIAGFRIKGGATAREKALSEQVVVLESDLAAVRRELEKARSGKKVGTSGKKKESKKAKIKKKTCKLKRTSRPRKRPTPKAAAKSNVAIKAQGSQPRVAKAKMSSDKSRKAIA